MDQKITFTNPWGLLAGSPAVMIDGARHDDLRLGWIHAIAERAGLNRRDGRLWVTFA